jgi:HD-like signal output (HDOD) protein
MTEDMTIQELIMESIGEVVLEEWRVADDIRRQIKAEADAIAAERQKKEQKIKDREEKTRKAEELRVKAK